MMGVYQRNGWWWVDYYEPDGRRRRKKISPEKRTALATLRDIQSKIARGEYLGLREEQTTFREAWERYWPTAKPTLSERERSRTEQIFRQHLLPRFGGRKLKALSRQEGEEYVAERATVAAPATANKELTRLRHFLGRCVAWRLLRENPCKGVKKLKESPPRVRYLVPEQIYRLRLNCEIHSPELPHIVALAMNTGMRRGELLALTLADVNEEARSITLRHTKSGEMRTVPLNTDARKALQCLTKPQDPLAPLFPGWTPNRLTMAFRRACRRAGVGNFRLHDLRHHAASWMAMRGVNQRAIMTILGHKDPRMTMRYQHLSTEALQEAVSVLEAKQEAPKADSELVSIE